MMLWGAILVVVGLAGIVATFLLMRRKVRELDELKRELR